MSKATTRGNHGLAVRMRVLYWGTNCPAKMGKKERKGGRKGEKEKERRKEKKRKKEKKREKGGICEHIYIFLAV